MPHFRWCCWGEDESMVLIAVPISLVVLLSLWGTYDKSGIYPLLMWMVWSLISCSNMPSGWIYQHCLIDCPIPPAAAAYVYCMLTNARQLARVPWPVLVSRGLVPLKNFPRANFCCGCLCGRGELTVTAGRTVVPPHEAETAAGCLWAWAALGLPWWACTRIPHGQACKMLLWGCQPGPCKVWLMQVPVGKL